MSNTAHSAAQLDETHTSVQLQKLIRDVPTDTFTLEWLIGHLPNRSFGVILLFLAIVTVLPIISIPARFLMLMLLEHFSIGLAHL